MAVFFQNIPDDYFNIDSDFVVNESKTMNTVVGVLFLIFSLAAFTVSIAMGGVAWLVAIGAFARSSKDVTIMRRTARLFWTKDSSYQ